jgi:Skp family chaperone for outer membrane proteins
MIQHRANKFLVGVGAVAGLVMVAVLVAAQPPGYAAERPESALKIGTYEPAAAFQAHPDQKGMMEALRTAQTQMQQAQQEKDQQKMQQIQKQYEQVRQQAVQKFQKDLSEVLPEVAKAAGVKVVATQVVYKAEGVQTVDLTPVLVKAFEK